MNNRLAMSFRSWPCPVWVPGALLVFAPLLAGCWGQGFGVSEVTGTVTLDGKPRKGLMVVFSPNDGQATKLPPAYGFTNDEGRYRAIRPGSKPGAVVGPTNIQVLSFDGNALVLNGRAVPNTEFQKEIVGGPNVVDIDLKSR